MSEFQVRTDLALEARERFEEDVEIRGVAVEESYDERRDIRVTVVRIQTENGAKAMGKPIGTYITLEAPRMSEPDEDYHREVSEKLAEYQKAQGAVTSALGKLLAITENYPDLKANQNFLELQAQLEGTENRINVARKNFNDAAQAYNTNIRRFPKNIFAGMFGFDKKAYFEAEEGSEKAPKVEF